MFSTIKKIKVYKDILKKPFKLKKNSKNFNKTLFYTKHLTKSKMLENYMLLEASHGTKFGGNPYALFQEIAQRVEFKHFSFVIVVNENDPLVGKIKETFGNRIFFVKRESEEYVKFLATCKYLINDTTFPFYFQKRADQIYINTWHGTPIKTLGNDVKGTFGQHKNAVRNFLHADFIINPNKFTSDIINKSHSLESIFTGTIIEEGYPRVDLTLNSNQPHLKKYFSELLNIDTEKKVILYAPTWRGELSKVGKNEDLILEHINDIKENIPSDYTLLLKVHNLTYNSMSEEVKKMCVPNWVETNELLSVVDILITDYSSICFDFMPLNRPIVFFTYDSDQYEEHRGFYLDLNTLPGPLCKDTKEVINSIENIGEITKDFANSYAKCLEKYCSYDDGKSSERIVDIIFKNDTKYNSYQILDENKTKVLIFGGGFTTNGVTTSLINLLNNVDYSIYDVSIVFGAKVDREIKANLKKLHPQVKILFRMGITNYTLSDYYKHDWILGTNYGKKILENNPPKELYQRELKRTIGDAKFDTVIDFSGYAPFWVLLIAMSDIPNKIMYLHSDMLADSKRKVNGVKIFKKNFDVIFKLYKRFDTLVSVSEDSANINKEKLAVYGVSDKIVNINNTIFYNSIFADSKDITVESFDNQKYIVTSASQKMNKLNLKAIKHPSDDDINFATVGRLSPEKDHLKLVKAFKLVVEKYPNAKLYIIGAGILEQKIRSCISKNKLTDNVILTGSLSNPHALVNLVDYFVLSSNYEGQGLALMEALVLGKTCISTDINGPRNVLKNGDYGKLVENNIKALGLGMIDLIEEEKDYEVFDYIKYNEESIEKFYSILKK